MVTPEPADRPSAARRGADLGASVAKGDWPAQAADAVVNAVDGVRDKTTGPALKVARGVVYGLLILIMAIVAFTLFVVALIRGLEATPLELWQVYLLLGGVFVVGGLLMYRLRTPDTPPPDQVGAGGQSGNRTQAAGG